MSEPAVMNADFRSIVVMLATIALAIVLVTSGLLQDCNYTDSEGQDCCPCEPRD